MSLNRFVPCFLLTLQLLQAQGQHPELRAIILEAIDLTKDIRRFPDRGSPQNQAAELLARAGYAEDAEEVIRQYLDEASFPPYYLWKSWAVYGPQQRMDQYLATLKDPNARVGILTSYASTLWRLGQKEKARQTYLAAQNLLPKVTILQKRTNSTNAIAQGLKYIDDDAPSPLSTRTIPLPKRTPAPSLVGRFPITPNGFTPQSPMEREASSFYDEKLIQELYASLKAGKLQDLDRIISSAATPFQKAMGIASVQHIMNQGGLVDLSEACARAIPTTDDNAKMAKAEALASAATALAIGGEKNRARALFIAAGEQVPNIPQNPLARIQVLVNIALRQATADFDADAQATWIRAIQLAQDFPSAPTVWNQRKKGVKYREEAFWPLISEAVEFQRIAFATQAANAWAVTDKAAIGSLVSALLRCDDFQLALATARKIPDPHLRGQELLSVASSWLNAIRAPNF